MNCCFGLNFLKTDTTIKKKNWPEEQELPQ